MEECEKALALFSQVVDPVRIPLLIQNARNARKPNSVLEYGLDYHLTKLRNAVIALLLPLTHSLILHSNPSCNLLSPFFPFPFHIILKVSVLFPAIHPSFPLRIILPSLCWSSFFPLVSSLLSSFHFISILPPFVFFLLPPYSIFLSHSGLYSSFLYATDRTPPSQCV